VGRDIELQGTTFFKCHAAAARDKPIQVPVTVQVCQVNRSGSSVVSRRVNRKPGPERTGLTFLGSALVFEDPQPGLVDEQQVGIPIPVQVSGRG
jgi:hypothetical protein